MRVPLLLGRLVPNAIAGAQIDGVDFGNPFIMQRQQWAMDMAMDESRLPPGAHGAGSYSSHPNDSTGTWAGDAAVISQIDAWRTHPVWRI